MYTITIFKSKVLSFDFITNQEKDFEWALKLHADSIWSEFISNKLSKITIEIEGTMISIPTQASFTQDIPLFIDSLFKMEADAKNCIEAYRSHGNIMRLYQEIQESAGFFLTMAGRIYGLLCIYDLQELMYESIKKTYAFEIWEMLCKSLDNLNSKYPGWEGVQEFDELAQVVLKTWNILGIYPRVNSKGLYIEVP